MDNSRGNDGGFVDDVLNDPNALAAATMLGLSLLDDDEDADLPPPAPHCSRPAWLGPEIHPAWALLPLAIVGLLVWYLIQTKLDRAADF